MQETTPFAKPKADSVQSVERALAILDAVAADHAATASGISRTLGLPVATVHRLLMVLVRMGYLTKTSRSYALGAKIGILNEALEASHHPGQLVLSAVHRLAQESGESVFASRWSREDVTVVASAEGVHPVRVAGLALGTRGYAYARAAGKALLAFAPPSRLERYVASQELVAVTDRTITSPDLLVAEIEQVRKDGYAIDREEFVEGICCVGAPVFERPGPLASYAITVTVPVFRFEKNREAIVRLVVAAAAELSDGLANEAEGQPAAAAVS